MDLIVTARPGEITGIAELGGQRYRCALGRSGIFPEKHEGDGATPVGRFALRRLYYRADRLPAPPQGTAGHVVSTDRPVATRLPQQALDRQDGWCDDAGDPAYNRPVRLPYAGRHEEMWLESHLYDLVVIIGHNDDPVVPGAGSAVFIHLARADYGPTEGCIAFARPDLEAILAQLGPDDHIRISLA